MSVRQSALLVEGPIRTLGTHCLSEKGQSLPRGRGPKLKIAYRGRDNNVPSREQGRMSDDETDNQSHVRSNAFSIEDIWKS